MTRFFKFLSSMLLALPLTFALAACDGDDDDDVYVPGSLIGDWVGGNYDDPNNRISVDIDFENGTFSADILTFDGITTSMSDIDGTYTNVDNNLTMTVTSTYTPASYPSGVGLFIGDTFTGSFDGNTVTLFLLGQICTLTPDPD